MGEFMKAKVTEQGVVIPKKFLVDAEEVDIRIEDNRIVLIPITQTDSILDFGRNPVSCGMPDASEKHDKYLYGSGSC